jgi:site-specific recombinase XerD
MISDALFRDLTAWKLKNPHSQFGLMFPSQLGGPLSRKDIWKALNRAVVNANEKDKTKRCAVFESSQLEALFRFHADR